MKLYLQHLNKANLPATDAILRKVLDIELKEKPANKPATIIAITPIRYMYDI